MRSVAALLFVLFSLVTCPAVLAQTFVAPRIISSPAGSAACCVVDVNGDGYPDVAAIAADRLQIMLNDGKGNLNVISSTIVPGVSDIHTLGIAGDVNGDGKVDLIVMGQNTSGYGSVVVVYLGNGDGTFQSPVTSQLYVTLSATAGVLGDFKGSGHLDILATYPGYFGGLSTTPGSTVLLAGDGTGHFTNDSQPSAVGSQVWALDLNGDGYSDLVFNNGGVLEVALNNKSGGFPGFTAVNSVPFSWIAAGDLYANGKTEFVGIPSSGSTATIYSSAGDGTLSSVTASLPGATGLYAIADVNGDGIPDLIAQNQGISVLLGRGGNLFSTPIATAGVSPVFTPLVADFTGDHKLDLLIPSSGQFLLFAGNGDGSFRSASQTLLAENVLDVAAADLNSDGHTDVVAAVSGAYPRVLLGNGTGALAIQTDQNAGSTKAGPSVSAGHFLVTGDFDGDGKVDVAEAPSGSSTVGGVNLLFGNGDGTFAAPISVPSGSLAVGDLNGDGRTDMVASTVITAQGFGILSTLGTASRSFTTVSSFPLGTPLGQPYLVDYNHDGLPDVLTSSYSSQAEIALGKGDGTFVAPVPVNEVDMDFTGASADFDNDGYTDLLFNGSGTIYILYGNSTGGFDAPVALTTAQTVRVADVNHDGKPDIVVSSSTTGNLQVFHNQGNRVFGAIETYPFGNAEFTLADLNADGYPEIIVPGPFNNVLVLLNTGSAGTATGTVAASPNPSVYGATVQLMATFAAAAQGAAVPTGTVLFDLDGTGLGSAPLINGSAQLSAVIKGVPGTHTIDAAYEGDATYKAITVSTQQVIQYTRFPVTLSVSATPAAPLHSQTVRVIANTNLGTVQYDIYGITDLTQAQPCVYFASDGLSLGTSLIAADGSAQVDTNTLTVGEHAITASVAAGFNDTQYFQVPATTSAPIKLTVGGIATATTLALSTSQGTAGTPVTLTAKVSASDGTTPFGAVTFYDGATSLGTVLIAGNQAVLSTAFTAAGQHSLSAVYATTASYLESTSAASNYVAAFLGSHTPGVPALRFTTTTLSGRTETVLDAQVVDPVTGASDAGHTVSFFDGSSLLGTSTTSANGIAELILPPLPQGEHQIRSVLSADTTLAAASSAATEQSDQSPPQLVLDTPTMLWLSGGPSTTTQFAVASTLPLSTSVAWDCQSSVADLSCGVSSASASTASLEVHRISGISQTSRTSRTPMAFAAAAGLLFVSLRRRKWLSGAARLTAALLLTFGLSSCARSIPSEVAVITVRATANTSPAMIVHEQQLVVVSAVGGNQ